MKGKALIWLCRKCRWITVSDQYPHRMDTCKCGAVSVDHEVDYTRYSAKDFKDYIFVAMVDMDKAKILDAGDHVSRGKVKSALKYISGHVPRKIRDSDGKINEEATHSMSELQFAIDSIEKELLERKKLCQKQ